MPRTTLSRRGEGSGGNERWNAAEDFEREARRARNAARAADRGSLAIAPARPAASLPHHDRPPARRAREEEETLVADGDVGNVSSLGDDDIGDGQASGGAAAGGSNVQAPLRSPAPTVHRPSESFSRSGRGKKPPAMRHRKILRDNMYAHLSDRSPSPEAHSPPPSSSRGLAILCVQTRNHKAKHPAACGEKHASSTWPHRHLDPHMSPLLPCPQRRGGVRRISGCEKPSQHPRQ